MNAPHRPEVASEEGRLAFNAILNERLPTKRVIAQGLLRNQDGAVLLCELTYKKEWDLPGGVVDRHESPATCVERECSEELGTEVRAGDLLTTTWLPPYRGWDDAVAFLFDLGTVPTAWADNLTLQAREIVAVHWCAPADLARHVAPYAERLIGAALDAGSPAYLENGLPRTADPAPVVTGPPRPPLHS